MPYIKQWMASPLKNKKYRVILSNGKHIDFGSKIHQHYRDTTPLKLYSHLDHNDKKRQLRYYSRHAKDYGPFTADWMSKHYLWGGY